MDWHHMLHHYLSSHIQVMLSAIIILVVGYLVALLTKYFFSKILHRSLREKSIAHFLTHLSYWLVIIITVMAALSKLGVQTTSLVAILGGLSLAIGLSMKNSLSEIAAAVLLILFKRFNHGDKIIIGSHTGTVIDQSIMFVTIKNTNNEQVIIPNSKVLSSDVTNLSKYNERQLCIELPLCIDNKIENVRKVTLDLIQKEKRVLKSTPPSVQISDLNGSSMKVIIKFTVLSEHASEVKWRLFEAIKKAHQDNKILLA